VFCDGDFWHGRHWRKLKSNLGKGTNASYWIAKVATNIQRDKRITKTLEKLGWQVVRLWETDIKKDPLGCALFLKKVIDGRQQKG
jgi:DNA mismatch endonuclease (patch repair protein)